MAYQNVGTPRFYVSILQWLKSLGKLTAGESNYIINKHELSLVDINPTSQATFTGADGVDHGLTYESHAGNYHQLMPNEKNFLMILGHNFSNSLKFHFRDNASPHTWVANGYEVVNYDAGDGAVLYNGFSIGRGNDAQDITGNALQLIFNDYEINVDYKLGSILYGTYYDMPHSPDLSLTLTREYGGIKTIETKGGASLSNAFYSKPPAWGGSGAWELSESPTGYPHALSKSGRRIWDLSFSYLDSGDVWGSNQSQGGLNIATGYDSGDLDDDNFEFNILTDDNFYSQVIHKTNGGQLPFIFQPDAPRLNTSTELYEGGNNNPDQLAIAKFDMKSFKFKQVANSVYNISLKIREIW